MHLIPAEQIHIAYTKGRIQTCHIQVFIDTVITGDGGNRPWLQLIQLTGYKIRNLLCRHIGDNVIRCNIHQIIHLG